MISMFFAYFAIAYLAGLLVTKLRQADVKLKDASGALENLVVGNLQSGTTYYFVLTAFDANGNESVFSSELSQTIP